MRAPLSPKTWRLLLLALLALTAALLSPLARAQEDPPGRVGRVADINGGVSWFDADQGQWAPAERNRPLTSGDRISTAREGRAELRIGSTTLRLANSSELEVLRLDDTRISVQLHSGGLAVRVRAREVADEIELLTAEVRLQPLRAGLYRVDRTGDSTQAGVWRGELRVEGPQGLVVAAGQRVDLLRADRPGALPVWGNMPNDGFTAWVMAEEASAPGDAVDARVAATRYVSPEMTGAEDLDRNGRWEQHPEFGAVWTPLQVQPDWAPYRYGRWDWVQPWGWTWVDDAPWGFAPFHYGRWAFWRDRWCWVPGAYVPRPVFAPALVGWVGGGGGGNGGAGWSLSVRVGGPPVGWVPLSPREAYQPAYRSTPVYLQRVNPPPPWRWQHPPGQRPAGPQFFANQEARNGMTVVAPDVLARRQPVARAVMTPGPDWRGQASDSRPPEGPRGEGPPGPRTEGQPAWRPDVRQEGGRDERRDERGAGRDRVPAQRPAVGGASLPPMSASPAPAAPLPPAAVVPAGGRAPAGGTLPLPDRRAVPMPTARADARPDLPAQSSPAEAGARTQPESQPPALRRGGRMDEDRRERPQRDGGRMSPQLPVEPIRMPVPTAPTAPPKPVPAVSVAPVSAPIQRQTERSRETRDARDPRTDGEQRGRKGDGAGANGDREGKR